MAMIPFKETLIDSNLLQYSDTSGNINFLNYLGASYDFTCKFFTKFIPEKPKGKRDKHFIDIEVGKHITPETMKQKFYSNNIFRILYS